MDLANNIYNPITLHKPLTR